MPASELKQLNCFSKANYTAEAFTHIVVVFGTRHINGIRQLQTSIAGYTK